MTISLRPFSACPEFVEGPPHPHASAASRPSLSPGTSYPQTSSLDCPEFPIMPHPIHSLRAAESKPTKAKRTQLHPHLPPASHDFCILIRKKTWQTNPPAFSLSACAQPASPALACRSVRKNSAVASGFPRLLSCSPIGPHQPSGGGKNEAHRHRRYRSNHPFCRARRPRRIHGRGALDR